MKVLNLKCYHGSTVVNVFLTNRKVLGLHPNGQ